MTVEYTVEAFTADVDRAAVLLTWAEVERILGREHSGSPDDDRFLTAALKAAGAPTWATHETSVLADRDGWRLVGPPVAY